MLDSAPALIVAAHVDAGDRRRRGPTIKTSVPSPSSAVSRPRASLRMSGESMPRFVRSPARRCTETVATIAVHSGVEISKVFDRSPERDVGGGTCCR